MAKENGAKVSKVEVEIGGKTISLTLAQVKELRDALNGLFGETVVERHVHHHDWWRRPWTYMKYEGSASASHFRLDSKREALCLAVK